jgi:deoxyribonuclease IV
METMNRALFGPSGNPESFYASGHKSSADMPEWLAAQGLYAYEYSLTRGVNVGEATAKIIGANEARFGIAMSVHAPYYISLASEDETTAANTTKHFMKSLEAAHWLGADRIAFHMGGCVKLTRRGAMETAKRQMEKILEEADRRGLSGPKLAAETHGKVNQLGTVDEIIEVCKLSPQMTPLVDFAHLYAVAGGGYAQPQDYGAIFEKIARELGDEAAKHLHIHFSSIEFSKGGEKRHWGFQDAFGPPHQPLMEWIAAEGLTPRIICESAGTQSEDAKTMQDFYLGLLKSNSTK